jgi:hypothetical protein
MHVTAATAAPAHVTREYAKCMSTCSQRFGDCMKTTHGKESLIRACENQRTFCQQRCDLQYGRGRGEE